MDDKKEKKFISERILGRELTSRRAAKYLLLSLLCGIVFGLAVIAVNYAAGKVAETAAEKEQEKLASEEETLPEDSAPEETVPQSPAETEPETGEGTENTTESSVKEESGETAAEPVEETGAQTEITASEQEEQGLTGKQEEELKTFLAKEQKSYEVQPEDLEKILGAQEDACSLAEKYLVKVVCTIRKVTWFESTVETQRQSSGVIVGVTDSEVLILTVKKAVTKDADYHVVFYNGSKQQAVVKQVAEEDGWAMFAVPKADLGTEFGEMLHAVKIVPLSEIVPGLPAITAGSPMGVAQSYGFGYLNYVGPVESIVDGSICCCYTEAASNPEKGTFLMDERGRLIGLAAEPEEENEISGNRFLIADSCRAMIEGLKTGQDQARLGITGMDISFDMKYSSMPEGMYVTDVEEDSPAFEAGLKRGDIIVTIGEKEISSLSDYCSFMRTLKPGTTVEMTVKRTALGSEYKELELTVTAEAK